MNKYSESMYIDAIMWSYGFTKTNAEKYLHKYKAENNMNTLNLLVEGFKRNAQKSFYED